MRGLRVSAEQLQRNGSITSPEIATLEADQGKGGCIVVVPVAGRGAAPINRSFGRFPYGHDADNLCTDFHVQPVATAGEPNKIRNSFRTRRLLFHFVRMHIEPHSRSKREQHVAGLSALKSGIA
jgi:hypothetical protein